MSSVEASHIIIIDDDEINNFICESLVNIHFAEFKIVPKTNPVEAIRSLEVYKNKILFVLLDINMPEMDGWEFLQVCIKNGLIDFPVYLLTSSISKDDKDKSLSFDCIKGFIHKPLTEDNLLKIKSEIKKPLISTTNN